jgi:hypothetical protein
MLSVTQADVRGEFVESVMEPKRSRLEELRNQDIS